MNIFVNKSERIDVNVYVWGDEDKLQASHIEEEVPKNVNAEIIKFTFKKVDYKDSLKIQQSIIKITPAEGTGEPTPDVSITNLQDVLLRTLLISITQNGETTDMKNRIDELYPLIARAAVAGVIGKISF